MSEVSIEHVNVTVADPKATAGMLCRLFDWQVRWHGPSQLGGYTYHVGGEQSYVAVYTTGSELATVAKGPYIRCLNHIGIQVDDLDAIEARVVAEGLTPYNHGDYEPGRRFYFNDADDVEYEVVAYG
ncbi:MAG: VOC family protein [Pseudomonadota bacterium]